MSVQPSIRLRLTLLYGGLFLLAGALLLVVNYGLVRSRLDPEPVRIVREAPVGAPGGDSSPEPPDRRSSLSPSAPEVRLIEEEAKATLRAYRTKTLRELVVQSGVALALMSVVALGLGWVVAGRVLRPLHQITATARRLSGSNLHERIGLEGPPDELKELADTFDDMLARLDEAFEGQRRFIANASHELRTPLAIQRTLVDVALTEPEPDPAELAAVADDLRAAIDRSERLIDGLLLLARSERRLDRWERVDFSAATAAAIVQVAAEANDRGVSVERGDAAPDLFVRGDPALIERAIANLVENAVRHNVREGPGWARVSTSTTAGWARLRVLNTGPVVDTTEVAQLFEPFRRLNDRTGSAEGSGLGLSIVQTIATSHGGAICARPRPDGGLDVELSLPLDTTTSPRR